MSRVSGAPVGLAYGNNALSKTSPFSHPVTWDGVAGRFEPGTAGPCHMKFLEQTLLLQVLSVLELQLTLLNLYCWCLLD